MVGSDVELNCTVEAYTLFDFNTSIHFNWSRSGMVLSNDSYRTTISRPHGSTYMFMSQLILSPLSANDSNITCSASVYSATLNPFIEISPTVSKHVQLNIEGTYITPIFVP
jgi:hypothetical protein